MNKNLTKKALVPAIAMVIASVIALSGVTYAWFTTGNTATVGSLDVNVQTANGIQVSLDAASWRSNITAEDIKSAAINGLTAYGTAITQVPSGEVLPVSSAGNIDANGRLEMFYGEYRGDGTMLSTQSKEEKGQGGHFIAFDLFFKSSSAQTMTLMPGSNETFVKCTKLTEDASDSVGTDTAVRVAFLPLGSDMDASAARGLKGNGGKALIWEPNATVRAPGSEGTANTKLPYNGFTKETASDEEDALDTCLEDQTTPTLDVDKVEIELDAGINKVRVYIWLEGQDIDCINNISFGDFTTNLVFQVPEV